MYQLGIVKRGITRADREVVDRLSAFGSATVHEAIGRPNLVARADEVDRARSVRVAAIVRFALDPHMPSRRAFDVLRYSSGRVYGGQAGISLIYINEEGSAPAGY